MWLFVGSFLNYVQGFGINLCFAIYLFKLSSAYSTSVEINTITNNL